jgi:hypothetical protein
MEAHADERIGNDKSACDKVSYGFGIVPFGSPRSRNQVSFGENWALHLLSIGEVHSEPSIRVVAAFIPGPCGVSQEKSFGSRFPRDRKVLE